MSKHKPTYGHGFHNFGDEQAALNDPWHERYRHGSPALETHGPKRHAPRDRKDEKIWDDVCDALTNAFDVDASRMDVDVDHSVVYLSGNVSSREEKYRAEQIAYHIFGVEKVHNKLHVDLT